MDNPPTSISHPSANGERRCVLVLGMHRGGTSVVTRIISLLGADLPQSLMRSKEDNPRGYWESSELTRLHDQLLACGGSRWDDWQPFPRPNRTIVLKGAIQDQLVGVLEREFGFSKLFVVQDPRMCRFVPIWLEVLKQFRTQPLAVIPLRHPFEVARSLHSRNGVPFSEGCLIWLRHVFEAERTTRQIPRAFVHYESLTTDWHEEVSRLATDLSIQWPRALDEAAPAVNEFLSVNLRHHACTCQELDTRSDVVDWIARTYHALRRLKAGGEDDGAYRELDRVREEFDRACLAFGGLLRAERTATAAEDHANATGHMCVFGRSFNDGSGEVPRPPMNLIDRSQKSPAGLRTRLPWGLPLRVVSAILACGRRIERGFRNWRRRESVRNPFYYGRRLERAFRRRRRGARVQTPSTTAQNGSSKTALTRELNGSGPT